MGLSRDILSGIMRGDGKYADRKKIIEGFFHSVFIQGISIVLIFAGNLLMARWAGADAYGKYVHVFNWISILSIMALAGQEDIAIARLPRYEVDNQPGRIWSFIRRSNVFILSTSLLVTAVFLLLTWLLPLKTLHENREEFLLASAAVYGMTFLTLNQNVLQALHYIRLSQWVEKWIKPGLLTLFTIFACYVLQRRDSGTLVVIGAAVTLICCMVLAFILVRKTRKFSNDRQVYPRENLMNKAAHFFSIDLLNQLSTKATMLILPYFSLQKEVGIFNISYRFADLVIYPFFLMNSVLPQQFSRHYNADKAHRQFLYGESTKIMALIALPLLLLNIVAGKWFLGWFGADFTKGYVALVQLSVAQFLFSLFGPAHTVLTMLDKEKYAVMALLVFVVILIAGNLILVPVWGINGGTLAVILGTLAYNIVLARMAWRHCGVCSPLVWWGVRRFRS